MISTLRVFSFICLLLMGSVSSHAGEIVGFTWFSGIASVAGEPVAPPTVVNNDATATSGTSPNPIIVYQKDYTGIGPVDLVFDVVDTGGVTEYAVYEGVQNGTGVDWSSYHIELGFGVGASFVKSLPGDGLDFDAPLFDSTVDFAPVGGTMPFPVVTVLEDDIFASGGVQPDMTYAGNFIFHVDVPDGITSFTIRQSPVPVPEPSAALIALMAISLAGPYRRRHRPAVRG